MRLANLVGCVFGLAIAFPIANAQNRPPSWVTEGPRVAAPSFALDLPLEVLATKLFVEVEIGGAARRFVFDTGSPSMMGRRLADELGLDSVGTGTGKDAHGATAESDIMQVDMTLGGTTFHRVPVFVADFSPAGPASCLFDGVLGSEVLPLCAWQVDLPDSRLRCHSELQTLNHIDEAARVPLYDYGYPHAPILDVRFGDRAVSKAMLDTGSPEYLAISPPDFDGASRNGGVGRTIAGNGSLGSSLGGRAPDGAQLQAELKTLSIGHLALGRVGAVRRERSPSLVGASMLEHFVVTLDARSQSAYFDRYRDGPFARSSFGFSLDFGPGVSVALVWDDSPAARAGLRTGHRVTSINGAAADTSCGGIRRALRALSEPTIDLEWTGGSATLVRANRLVQ